jgi:lipopolysaccharide O-acetyltransferase
MNKIEVGDDVLVASKVYISDHAHGFYKGNKQSNPKIPPSEREYDISSVYIGNRVWIGENVCILPGVSIGDGSIIGANSVVNNNIPTNSIAVGSPAKVIKFFNENDKKWKKSVQYKKIILYFILLSFFLFFFHFFFY